MGYVPGLRDPIRHTNAVVMEGYQVVIDRYVELHQCSSEGDVNAAHSFEKIV